MSNSFNWRHLVCAQVKIDILTADIEREIVSKTLDEKIELYSNTLNSPELNDLKLAKEFCEQQIIKLKRERLLIRYPRHRIPKRVQKGHKSTQSDV